MFADHRQAVLVAGPGVARADPAACRGETRPRGQIAAVVKVYSPAYLASLLRAAATRGNIISAGRMVADCW